MSPINSQLPNPKLKVPWESQIKNILLGVGNPLHSDDGVGPYVAQHFKADDWLSIDCATSPENFTGVVKKYQPEHLVIVDAADMNLPTGCIKRINQDMIRDISFDTHTLPLSVIMDYLKRYVQKEIIFIAIQPGDLSDSQKLSKSVNEAATKTIELLKSGEVFNMPLHSSP